MFEFEARDGALEWRMAVHNLAGWQHNHAYDTGNRAAERRTWIVVAITAVTMVAEIVAGYITGSMALLADGWHRATHVVALSIGALAAGLWLGWSWLDPMMGVVGAGVILWWSKGLLADLHVWRVGRASHAAVLTVVAHAPLAPATYRERLAAIPSLMHVSVEVNRCPHRDCPDSVRSSD